MKDRADGKSARLRGLWVVVVIPIVFYNVLPLQQGGQWPVAEVREEVCSSWIVSLMCKWGS